VTIALNTTPHDRSILVRILSWCGNHKSLIIGATIVSALVLAALFAPLIAPYSPFGQDLNGRLVPPQFLGGSSAHLLGTDLLGRDYLSRLIYGARASLAVASGTVLLSSILGVTLGMLGGFYGGKTDLAVVYLITVRLSLPSILVALSVVGLIGGSLPIIMTVLAGLLWDQYAIVSRSLVIQLRDREFVQAARAAGCSNLSILIADILPCLVIPLITVTTLEMAHAVMLEAALSFLGLGIKPPMASWGLMIAEARDFVFFDPWLVNIPGFALLFLVLGINLLGEGLSGLFGRSTLGKS
jgi:peptide/nickel transport system permease protein